MLLWSETAKATQSRPRVSGAPGTTAFWSYRLAAEYVGSSVGTKKSFRYKLPDGNETFFTEDGLSARKTFLKSPLKYATVTSGFGSRFHPVLKYRTSATTDPDEPVPRRNGT